MPTISRSTSCWRRSSRCPTCTTKCCSSSSTRPRNCGSSRCCTSSRWRSRWSRQDHFAAAYKAMARIGRIQAVMTLSWDVLATLTPVDYTAFRDVLGTSSGFQSVQFRELEYPARASRTRKFLEHSRRRQRRPCPAARPRSTSRACGTRPMPRSSAPGSTSATARARRSPRPGSRSIATPSAGSTSTSWPRNWSTSTTRWPAWRHKHVLTVERIIGNKPGTGGSAGAAYLRSTLDKRAFPELWSLRTGL